MTRPLYFTDGRNGYIVAAALIPCGGDCGTRQVSKTSLAQHIAAAWTRPTLYLDLENPRDLNKTRWNVIVAPVLENYPLKDGFEVVSYANLPNLFE